MVALYIIKVLPYSYIRWMPTFIQTIFENGGNPNALLMCLFISTIEIVMTLNSTKLVSIKLSLIEFYCFSFPVDS